MILMTKFRKLEILANLSLEYNESALYEREVSNKSNKSPLDRNGYSTGNRTNQLKRGANVCLKEEYKSTCDDPMLSKELRAENIRHYGNITQHDNVIEKQNREILEKGMKWPEMYCVKKAGNRLERDYEIEHGEKNNTIRSSKRWVFDRKDYFGRNNTFQATINSHEDDKHIISKKSI